MTRVVVPGRRVYRSKFPPPDELKGKDLGKWVKEELRQVTRTIEEVETDLTGLNTFPFFTPEQFGVTGDEEDTSASAVSDAFEEMILATEEAGGGVWYLQGSYPVERSILVPSNTFILGVARGEKPTELNGGIWSTSGDFDILKFGQDIKNITMMNICLGHHQDLTPTAGCLIDARWLKNALFLNCIGFNGWNGIDLGVARSIVLQGIYLRAIQATSSGIGTDADGTPDHGFGIYIRSTQTLLDGNVGREDDFYDRDGPGITVEESSKGTSVVLRDIFINGGTIGEADDDGAVFENYTTNFTSIWIRGGSTIRVERAQCRHSEYGIRIEYAPNREGVDRDGDETGVQMAADIRVVNGSGEGNLNPYWVTGFEKVTLETCQANSSARQCFDIGDNTSDVWPGMSGGIPVREFGGFCRLINCLALTPREEGYQLRSGKIIMQNCIAAGYGLHDEDSITPARGLSFTATSTSQTLEFPVDDLGPFIVRNDGAVTLRFTIGNSGVTEDNGAENIPGLNSVIVTAGDFIQFTRTNAATQSHIAVRTSSGTADGETGPQAPQDSTAVMIRSGCIDGVWINGGQFSYDKDIGDHTPPTQATITIQDGSDRIWIKGADLVGGYVDNNAETTLTEADIGDFVGYDYNFSTYAQVKVRTETTNTTLAMADNGNFVIMNSGSARNCTIPLNSSVPFPIGAQITIANRGTADLTVVAAGGVTLITNNATVAQGVVGFAVKLDTNTWLFGR